MIQLAMLLPFVKRNARALLIGGAAVLALGAAWSYVQGQRTEAVAQAQVAAAVEGRKIERSVQDAQAENGRASVDSDIVGWLLGPAFGGDGGAGSLSARDAVERGAADRNRRGGRVGAGADDNRGDARVGADAARRRSVPQGPALTPRPRQNPRSPAWEPPRPNRIACRVSIAPGVIEAQHGTAFEIGPGLYATAAHVVAGDCAIEVDGRPARLARRWAAQDVALIKAHGSSAPPRIPPAPTPAPGDVAISVGYPGAGRLVQSGGWIGTKDHRGAFMVGFTVASGASGSPVYIKGDPRPAGVLIEGIKGQSNGYFMPIVRLK